MDSSKGKDVKQTNYVHSGIIHTQNIYRERKFENRNIKTQYTFSPFACKYYKLTVVYPIAEKPTNIHPKDPYNSKVVSNMTNKREYKVKLEPISNI
jgi:hypothetical protein